MDDTKVYSSSEIKNALIETTIKEVIEALNEKGYNSINQLVGYLMSGDPGYISSHNNARAKITKFNRIEVLEVLVRNFISK